jgi:Mg2+ and Co2+ transporter CorA
MVQKPAELLWIHGDEPEDIFPLQGIFGLHPLSVEAVTHQNQPSKVEEYDEYLFTIIDGVRYDEWRLTNNSKGITIMNKTNTTTSIS